ncbi:MAG: hypothetical protein ACFFEJ_08765 [Candidatus Thorarchaeota archaeon]
MEFDRVVLKDGSTSKMIEYKGRSFDDVLTDVQSFIYIRGFDTARRLLKFILLRIGLPNVETFPRDDELTEEDMDELSGILEDIDQLSDRFLSAKHREDTAGIEEIAKVRKTVQDDEPLPDPSIWESDEPVELVFRFNPENLPGRADSKAAIKEVDWESVRFPIFESNYETELENLKVILLGSSQVGKRAFLASAGFGIQFLSINDGDAAEEDEIYYKIVHHHESNYRMDSWVSRGSPSREFFANTSIIVLMYSVIDRASFQSIDYWIEEVSRVLLNVPPILLVANKIDLRNHHPADNHIQTEEGIQLKKLIEEKLGTHRGFHPVYFIETSCEKELGLEEAIRNIVKLWLENEKIVLPLID